jgi:hypothetical protein
MVLAWAFKEIGRIRPEVAPPQEIHTIEHVPWQAPNFPISRALRKVICDMLKERFERGTLEYCQGPYRNPWFLVEKKPKGEGKYRLINAAMEINRVTIKDANLPPSTDEFAEEFAGMLVGSFIDFFSGYNQMGLAEKFRNITVIYTPLGLLRQTTILQGATNSISQFTRVVYKILEEHIPHIAMSYMNKIEIKGPRDRYNNEEVPELSDVRRFIYEHIRNLDIILADIERAEATISGEKSKFCVNGMKIVDYICDSDKKYPQMKKVAKILLWGEPKNTADARAFVGLCVYYRIWIPYFALVAAPIYATLRSGVRFFWSDEQKEAMRQL